MRVRLRVSDRARTKQENRETNNSDGGNRIGSRFLLEMTGDASPDFPCRRSLK